MVASLSLQGVAQTEVEAEVEESVELEPRPVTIGHWHSIESEILGETREYMVSTPRGYDEGESRYAVMYVLDGSDHFAHATGLVDFLSRSHIDLMPPTIVVGVTNTDRTRDMTPPTREDSAAFPTAGGADNFIAFLRDELMPHVDASFRTNGHTILVGHSFGGLFAVHALVHEPELVDSWIAISPSLFWDDQMLVEQAEVFFEERDELRASLYMTMGKEGNDMLGGMLKLAGVIEGHTPEGFEWGYRVMKEESHNSVVHRSLRQGLEFVFADWKIRDVLSVYDSGGMEAVEGFYERTSARYGIEKTLGSSAVYELAGALTQSRRLDEAWEILNYDPERVAVYPMFFLFLGEEYEHEEDLDGALRCYERALELEPDNEAAQQKLEELHGQSGD
jgi:predicted alpha/beta superfamily hydrolase